jgi:hypothetical protein
VRAITGFPELFVIVFCANFEKNKHMDLVWIMKAGTLTERNELSDEEKTFLDRK